MSGPRILTVAEVQRWAAAIRESKPIGGASSVAVQWFESVVATALAGAVDRKREDVDAIEREAASVARFLLDQARR